MKKSFFWYKFDNTYYLESLDTGSYFSLGLSEFDRLKNNNAEVINFLRENEIFKTKSYNSFSAMLLLNNLCNLNCSYCFERSSFSYHQKAFLSDAQIEYITNNLKQNNEIIFSGGEPLLSFDLIKKICVAVENKGKKSGYSIITNGILLTDEIIAFFDHYHFHMQLSLDGSIPKNNDKRDRTNAKIDATILNNIIKILNTSTNISITLRINFSKNDIQTFTERMDKLLTVLQPYLDRIEIDLAIVDLPSDNELYMSAEEKFNAYMKFYLYLFSMHIKLPSHIINGGKCMARDKDFIMLDAKGERYPCFSFAGNKSFIVSDDSFFSNASIYCDKECYLHDICLGGCIYKNYCDSGKIDALCHFEFLDRINKMIFLMKLSELKFLNHIDFDEEIRNVKTFSINV